MTYGRFFRISFIFLLVLLPAFESMAKVYLTQEQALKMAFDKGGTVTEKSV